MRARDVVKILTALGAVLAAQQAYQTKAGDHEIAQAAMVMMRSALEDCMETCH